jgi:iron complex outermembrane recepter protein
MMRIRQRHARGLGVLSATLLVGAAYADNAAPQHFAIAAQPLSEALRAYADQTGEQVVFFSEVGKDQKSTEVVGDYTDDEALRKLLANTGLAFERIDQHTIAITRGKSTSANTPAGRGGDAQVRDELHVAQADQTQNSAATSVEQAAFEQASQQTPVVLEEVVVTGSNIRGSLEYQASEIVTLTRTDIARTGATDVAGLLQTIPQNFSGGTYGAIPDGVFGTNTLKDSVQSGAVAPNLRGLGTDSTLSLLDGHRLAPAESGTIIDIGMIPLDAIERVDVLTDGASAIYGTDAIGGVVNIILRKDYEGVETTVNGSSDDGADYRQGQFATTGGHHWDSGNALLSLDYSEQTPLLSKYRAYTNSLPVLDTPSGVYQSELYPDERQVAVLGDFRQQLGSIVDLSSDVFFGHRNYSQGFTSTDVVSPLETIYSYNRDASAVNELSASLSLGVKLPADWRFQTDLLYGRTDEHPLDSEYEEIPASKLVETFNIPSTASSRLYSVVSKADGTLFTLPAGAAKAAVGVEYRHESYDYMQSETVSNGGKPTYSVSDGAYARHLRSAFTETSVPLISPDRRLPGAQSVALTAAVRYDDYSDVGNTTNYKLGLKWRIVDSLALRATRSTSFRAPDLQHEIAVGRGNSVGAISNYFIGPDGKTVPVIRLGQTSLLMPETATATTAGFDLTPLQSLKLGMTAFRYDYINRFAFAPQDPNEINEPAQYGPLVTPITSVTQVEQLISQALAKGGIVAVPQPYSIYQYIIDASYRNLSRETVRGLDANLTYTWHAGNFAIEHALAGTLMSWDKDQITATSAPIETVGLVGYQPRFRARGSTTLSQSGWSVTGTLNYVSEFYNGTAVDAEHVGSWLTFDAVTRVSLDSAARDQLGLSIINVFNRDPPYVYRNPPGGPFYDPANANPLGRVFTLRYTHKW